jgi:hypothetical protein
MPVARLFRLFAVVMVLLGGPMSAHVAGMAGWFALPRHSRSAAAVAERDAVRPGVSASATGAGSRASIQVRLAVRAGGPFSMLSHAFDPSLDAGEEDAPGLPAEVEDDCCDHDFAIAQLRALPRRSLVPDDVESEFWGIQPSLGHPLGLEEPPRT